MAGELRREFTLRDLVLFHITAVITVRWISYAAARGPSSLILWGLAFFLFFLPIAFTVIDFTRKMPEQGGLYQWTKKHLGTASRVYLRLVLYRKQSLLLSFPFWSPSQDTLLSPWLEIRPFSRINGLWAPFPWEPSG